MKRILALFMVIVLLMCTTACSEPNETQERTCQSCGKGFSADVSFCGYCGASVNDNQSEVSSTTDPIETITVSDSTDTTVPSTEDTQAIEQPTETQKPTEPPKPTESQKPTETQKPTHTHSYSKKITAATCTQQGYTTYTCSCGDTYTADYVSSSHNYVNNVCSSCGATNANYTAYQTEYAQLTNKYNADVAELQNKIATSQSNIEKSQQAINNARGSLASLSPSCPQWFLQQYINNWQAYGDTYAATQAAQNAWKQQYNSQKAQYESAISINTSKIQTEQTNISMYNTAISTRTTQYNNDISALKVKYGIS